MDKQPSEVGDWQQLSVLGSGAFGTVMLWCNRKKSDFVAIKKCKFQKDNTLSAKQKERWHMEVDFMRSINHPNIIGFKKLDPELEEMINKYNPTKLPLLSMEYCTKGNLRRYLTSEPIKLCGLQEHDVRYILADISGGLSYLHSNNITHRDIKPENIVLQHCEGRKGETLYKIIDLGYAKELQDATLSFVGTLQYLAPEIFYNRDYTSSVDYWSMGIMIFEIVCGSQPFLPEMNPFERFEKIKDKGPDDICIYLSYSGAVAASTELKKEHFVTSCFKQNIEMWLKKVLQFDPDKRMFSNGLNAFEYLGFILDKKIVRVFSVYKQEFYSYEINDGTLLGTLKDWISRDIKVQKKDFFLLFRNEKPNENDLDIWYCSDDETIVESLLRTEDTVIYVYRRDTVANDKVLPKVPHLVKDLFNASSSPTKFSRQLYRQSLFFVYSELNSVVVFKSAYFCLMKYIENLCDEIHNKYLNVSKKMKLLMLNIEEFLEKKKSNSFYCDNNNLNLSDNKEFTECLRYFERLLSNVERREQNLKDFGKQTAILRRKKAAIADAKKEIENIFDEYDLSSQFEKINGKPFFEKQNGQTHDIILKRIKDVISDTTKLKCKLFIKNEDLKNYSKDFCYLLESVERLGSWVNDFMSNIEELINDFVAIEERYEKIMSEALKSMRKEITFTFNQDDSLHIIEENKLLRCQFEDILSRSVLAHKDYVDDSSDILSEL